MKRILCYGNSNTWGYDPLTLDRFDEHTRWTRVLGKALGSAYEVIEEGLNGRTTVWDDPIEGYKSGKEYLIPCLESHKPLDLVVILLGTNDLKLRFGLSAYDVAEGASVLVGIVQGSLTGVNGRSPQVLLLAPPPTTTLSEYAEMFDGAEQKSMKFSTLLCPASPRRWAAPSWIRGRSSSPARWMAFTSKPASTASWVRLWP